MSEIITKTKINIQNCLLQLLCFPTHLLINLFEVKEENRQFFKYSAELYMDDRQKEWAQFMSSSVLFEFMRKTANFDINLKQKQIILKWKILGHGYQKNKCALVKLQPSMLDEKQSLTCEVVALKRTLQRHEKSLQKITSKKVQKHQHQDQEKRKADVEQRIHNNQLYTAQPKTNNMIPTTPQNIYHIKETIEGKYGKQIKYEKKCKMISKTNQYRKGQISKNQSIDTKKPRRRSRLQINNQKCMVKLQQANKSRNKSQLSNQKQTNFKTPRNKSKQSKPIKPMDEISQYIENHLHRIHGDQQIENDRHKSKKYQTDKNKIVQQSDSKDSKKNITPKTQLSKLSENVAQNIQNQHQNQNKTTSSNQSKEQNAVIKRKSNNNQTVINQLNTDCKSFVKIGNKVRLDFQNGDYYYGQTQDNQYHGEGLYKSIINGTYEGQWINGKGCGHGVSVDVFGNRHSGLYYDDYKNGQGIEQYANGEKYEGSFLNSTRDGFGIYFFKNGDRYEGEWKNDLQQGKGRYINSDGSIYQGIWKNDQKHGPGVEYGLFGQIEQVWENGKLLNHYLVKIHPMIPKNTFLIYYKFIKLNLKKNKSYLKTAICYILHIRI